jgi:hypothetical protein
VVSLLTQNLMLNSKRASVVSPSNSGLVTLIECRSLSILPHCQLPPLDLRSQEFKRILHPNGFGGLLRWIQDPARAARWSGLWLMAP